MASPSRRQARPAKAWLTWCRASCRRRSSTHHDRVPKVGSRCSGEGHRLAVRPCRLPRRSATALVARTRTRPHAAPVDRAATGESGLAGAGGRIAGIDERESKRGTAEGRRLAALDRRKRPASTAPGRARHLPGRSRHPNTDGHRGGADARRAVAVVPTPCTRSSHATWPPQLPPSSGTRCRRFRPGHGQSRADVIGRSGRRCPRRRPRSVVEHDRESEIWFRSTRSATRSPWSHRGATDRNRRIDDFDAIVVEIELSTTVVSALTAGVAGLPPAGTMRVFDRRSVASIPRPLLVTSTWSRQRPCVMPMRPRRPGVDHVVCIPLVSASVGPPAMETSWESRRPRRER